MNGGKITNEAWLKLFCSAFAIEEFLISSVVFKVRRELKEGVRMSTVEVIQFSSISTGVDFLPKPSSNATNLFSGRIHVPPKLVGL